MKKRRCVTAAILAAAVAMIVWGVWTGEPAEVWNKAIHICLECIGIS